MPTAKAKPKKRIKKPITPNSVIRSALRLVWLRSRERAECLRLANRTCAICGKKHSVRKGHEVMVEVHHAQHEPDWERIFRVIREELLQSNEQMMALCVPCHDLIHDQGKSVTLHVGKVKVSKNAH